MLKIKSSLFILLFALFMVTMNFVFLTKFFAIINFHQEKLFPASLPFLLTALLLIVSAFLLLPYLSKFIAILFTLVSASSSYFMYNYGTIIDSEMIRNALQTDAVEAGNLISIKLILWIIILGIIPSIIILKTKIEYSSFKKETLSRIYFIIGGFSIIGLIFAGFSQNYVPFFRQNNNLRYYILPYYPIYSSIKLYKKINKKPTVFTALGTDAKIPENNKKRIMVFVVGETERSDHYSLNGYIINETNPYLKKQENLISFSNFYSCGTATATSVPCMFSPLERTNFDIEKSHNMSNLLDILQKINVNIFWFGNNSGDCQKVCNRLPLQNVQQYRAKNGFDEIVYNDAKKAIDDAQDNTLIIIHIQGSHGPVYYEGYPDKFKKFTPTCDTEKLETCTEESIINTYDNTILYQDYLQNDLIEHLKSKKGDFEKSFMFISDHGESLGENGIYLHGMPYSIAPMHQKKVPAIFWFDDNEEKLTQQLSAIKEQEFSHDYIFHTILGYFNVNTNIYNEKLDIQKITTK